MGQKNGGHRRSKISKNIELKPSTNKSNINFIRHNLTAAKYTIFSST